MRFSRIDFLVAVILSLFPAIAAFGGEPVATLVKTDFFITRDQSPWDGYTNSYAEEEAGKTIAAVSVTPEMARVPHLASFTHEGIPFLVIDRANRRVVVSDRFFSQIKRPDATNLPAGEPFAMGRVIMQELLEKAPFIVEFLLESQLIQTYHHLEASMKCIEQNTTKDSFTAVFKGSHIYFTNDRNESAFAFRIRIDKKTGEITVTGLAR